MTQKQLADFQGIREVLEIARKPYLENLGPASNGTYIRNSEDASFVLGVLEKIQKTLFTGFEEWPSLEGLFDKEFGSFCHFIQRENILDLCYIEDYLFPESEGLPIVLYDQFDKKLIESYVKMFQEWLENKIQAHKDCQSFLQESFTDTVNVKSLYCHCNKCIGDYRGKLRESVFYFCLDEIDKMEKWIHENVEKRSIDDIGNTFSDLRKTIEKKIHQVRYRLKKASLNKLDKQLKQILHDRFSPETEVAQRYSSKLREFCFSCLDELDIQAEFVNEKEFQRFYEQLGINIWKNEKFICREFTKLARSILVLKRKDISSNILQDHLGQFWMHSEARRMDRKVIYHMGPTNSGKTFHAIEALAQAKRGCYLAPLRLLASELYDTLTQKGVSTTLLTGEEVIETAGATHYSSTIEMARFHEDFDTCVIDEIQMVTDSQRGWAWTRAFVNIRAHEIHVCGDQSVLELIETMVKMTGDSLEIKEYTRLTELKLDRRAITAGDLEKGDAVIVFSRKKALKYKSDLERMGFKVSIVYGRLSPEVRREQARKFDCGETDVIVSTDAISMGMNLPIKRIVFTTLSKFINSKECPITDSEIKQISGRAGRYGRYPVGFVTCFSRVDDGLEKIHSALESELEQNHVAMVGPDLEIFESVNKALSNNGLKILRLSEFLRLFNTMIFKDPFYCVDLVEMIEVAEMVEEANKDKLSLSSSEIFGFTCAPVNLGLVEHVQYFVWIVNRYVNGLPIESELVDHTADNIDYLETSIKCVELYQWLARHFNNKNFLFDEQDLLQNKTYAIEKLNDLLSEKLIRNCSSCGVRLDDNHEFNICEKCFKAKRFVKKRPFRSNGKKAKNGKKGRGGRGKKTSSKRNQGGKYKRR